MKQILLLVSLFISSVMIAGEVTEQEALKKAQQFMQGKQIRQKSLRRAATTTFAQDAFYVFNAESNSGFVIVSADDRTEAILGYADQGTLDLNNLPVNAKNWLEGYAKEIKSLSADAKAVSSRRVIGEAVAPLVNCHWDQDAPYNLQCPMDGTKRSVTGCVATAMAQVMYYHKWPETVGAIPEYTTGKKSIEVPALSGCTLQWSKMTDEYKSSDTGEAADAVAQLMRYCGQAVKMDYTGGESAASINAEIMKTIFNYSVTARDVYRYYYGTDDWESLIYNELKASRPVLYSGQAASSGHQFVIDGYDSKGLFHVNWGWGGYSDGYFVLSVLNPTGRGIGGGNSKDGYSMSQSAIIGLKKPEASDVKPYSLYQLVQYDDASKTFTRSSSSVDFSNVLVYGSIIAIESDADLTVQRAWGLYQGDKLIKQIDETETEYKVKIADDHGLYSLDSYFLNFGANLADGTYGLKLMYRFNAADTWIKCPNSGPELLVTINGNTLTLKDDSEIDTKPTINSVTVNGDKKEGRPMSVVIDWTKKSYENEQEFYVWLSTEEKCVGARSSYIAQGETEKLEIAFIPQKVGKQTLKVSTDYIGSNAIYTEEITIVEAPVHNMKAEIKSGSAESTTIKAKVEFKNNGTVAYDDNVIFELTPIDADTKIVGDPIDVLKPLNLSVGSSQEVEVEFTGLASNQKYMLDVYYYSKSENGYTRWAVDGYYTTGAAATLTFTEVYSTTPAVQKDGETYYIIGDQVEVRGQIKNTGSAAYNGKIAIQQKAKKSDHQVVDLKDVEYRDFTLDAGASTQVSFTINKSANTDYYLYYAIVSEVGEGDVLGKTIFDTPVFEFRSSDGIGTIHSDMQEVKWYTIDGRPTGSPRKGLNIMRKADGTTRKVMIK